MSKSLVPIRDNQIADARNMRFRPDDPQFVNVIKEQSPKPGDFKGCRDCKFSSGDLCKFPAFGEQKLNVFTGGLVRDSLPKWENLRQPNGLCGVEARLWQRRGPLSNFRTYGWLAAIVALFGLGVVIYVSYIGFLILATAFILALISGSLAGDS
jgi:hypothetical protein